MPSHITSITAAQRLDSRGNPTVQVTLTTDKGIQFSDHSADFFSLMHFKARSGVLFRLEQVPEAMKPLSFET